MAISNVDRSYDRTQAREILQKIIDFIGHGEVTSTDGVASHGHPCFYLLHTKDETAAKLDKELTKKKEFNRYDICYIARKIIKYDLGEYDTCTTVKLLPRTMTMPAKIQLENGVPIIVDTSAELKDYRGWKIAEINRVPIRDILSDIEDVTAYATDEWLEYKMETTLVSPMLTSLPSFHGSLDLIRYHIEKDDSTHDITMGRPGNYSLAGLRASHKGKENYSFEIKDDVVVIRYFRCRDQKRLDRLMYGLKKANEKQKITKYVIDLRDNRGGNIAITDQLLDFLKGNKLVTITNGRIYSTGAMTLAKLKSIGSYTVGTDIGMSLDGFTDLQKVAMDEVGLTISRSVGGYEQWDEDEKTYHHLTDEEFKKQYNADHLPELHFYHPDQHVYNTAEDTINGHDSQLEAALEYLAE